MKAVSSYTRAIIINSPNNPSGAIYPEELVAELVEFCEKKGIYHKLVFDGKVAVSPYKYSNRDVETTKVITINGVSKLYGMTGFRIGWCVANRKLMEIMTNVQAQTTTT